MTDRHWWHHTSEEIYAYRTRKPHGFTRIPVIGTHWGYAGRTRNPKRRDAQHRYGYVWDGERKPAQPWSDLITSRRVIFRRKRRMEITTHLLEMITIRVLFPVYNIQMNRTNPRRIKPWEAQAQRRYRNRYGRPAQVVPAAVKLTLYAGVTMIAFSLIHIAR
jgi:hypothetical protein